MPRFTEKHFKMASIALLVVGIIIMAIGSSSLKKANEKDEDKRRGARLMITFGVLGAVAGGAGFHDAWRNGPISKKLGLSASSRASFQARVAAAAAKLRSSIEMAKSSCAMASHDVGSSSGDMSASQLAALASARISSFLAQQM